MYNSTLAQTAPVLAVTGVATAFHVVAAWTLLVAGLALVTTARVLRRRAAARRAEQA
ncbi:MULTISPECIES: hypothetical protein [Cellulosimicrobium]|jgi:hypothetical protein|uniref:Uncharacterized protein n=2 Tax=Cellulosimicrobium cellulans TaxID=1710 RepID=A0A0M0F9Z9_CELCE|nr:MULTISPECIES: hypothetical protein [Cellulosimicrobium]KON74414.1 hypothetical protein M768_00385 [Cellulosimicrobium cellulans F16]MBE9939321.1 hypothetical protein [Cellulosimicrobium cellulans]UTT59452.1 hypothetical protein NMQ07_00990 [Cellulosimicrobium cellulans]GLY55467.1 hypothetical protein Ccel01_00690 [Cellulosimicrobium cellulans]